jgi:hypothetical protein
MVQYFPSITGSLTVNGNLIVSGSISTSGSITISGSVASASYAATLEGLGSASFAPAATFNVVSSSYASASGSLSTRVTTNETNITTLTNASASFAVMSGSLSTRVTNLESTSSTVSSSFATTSGSIAGRVTIIEGQDATTGSNNFTAPQQISDTSNAISFTSTASLYTDGGLRVAKDSFISGTAYFNNIIVYGTSSIQYITSSQVDVGTNIITVNTDTPAVRFGGLAVFDSGSTQLTGSILWDSETNHWVYSNPSGSSYSGGMIMSGPRAASLGTEQGTTNNALMKGQGGDHITSSQIFDDGTTVRIPGNLQVTGSTILTGALTGSSATFSGNMGIGTTALVADSLLPIQINAVATTGQAYFASNNAGGYGLLMGYDNANGYARIRNVSNTALTFETNNSEKMRLTASGNLGLGVTPSAWSGSISSAIEGRNGSAIAFGFSGLPVVYYLSNAFFNGSNWIYKINGNAAVYALNNNDGSHQWATAPSGIAGNTITFSEQMRITSGGSVGIGTSTPDIYGFSAAGKYLTLQANPGGFSLIQVISDGTSGCGISFGNPTIRRASIDALNGSDLAFYTNASNSGTTVAEQMRITSGGNVGIGVAPDYRLDVNGVTQIRDTLLTTKQIGFFYAQTSASGATSFVNTGIFYNTSITGFSNNGTYFLAVTGNPNALGSNEYRGVYLGYITVTTGFDFGITSVVQRISYTQIVTGDAFNIGGLTISVVFWNGTTETTQQVNGTTNNQIRVKITGYNGSAVGAAQDVRITKII